jgi:hypothetical protein
MVLSRPEGTTADEVSAPIECQDSHSLCLMVAGDRRCLCADCGAQRPVEAPAEWIRRRPAGNPCRGKRRRLGKRYTGNGAAHRRRRLPLAAVRYSGGWRQAGLPRHLGLGWADSIADVEWARRSVSPIPDNGWLSQLEAASHQSGWDRRFLGWDSLPHPAGRFHLR